MCFASNTINKLKKMINNLSIKKKLISMYILCVLMPILLINSILYFVISSNVKEKELTILKQSVDSVANRFVSDIEQCIGVYVTINSDSKLNVMLDTIYDDTLDYYNSYHDYMKDSVEKFISVYRQVKHIDIYTKNESIVNSTYFHVLDDNIIKTRWYKKFKEIDSNILVYAFSEDNPNSYNSDKKYLSIINQPYSYTASYSANKVIKIDIRLESMIEIINREKTDGFIYVVDKENKIVFSNNPNSYNNSNEFLNFNSSLYSDKDIIITKNFENKDYVKNWRVIGVFPKSSAAVSVTSSKKNVILIALIAFIVATLVIFVISNSIKSRLELISKHLKGVHKEKFDIIQYDAGEDEIGELIKEYNNSTIRIKKLIEVVYKTEIEKTKAELRALQSQVNPHFLFNTLNTVRLRSVLKGENETAEIIKYMAKLFRRLLAWEEDLITIKEELEFVANYLEIQKYRYGDKLNYKINVDESSIHYKIPKMCIQTLVENSSVHGVEQIGEVGIIIVNITIIEDKLICTVSDNGLGIQKDKLNIIEEALRQGKSSNGSYGTINIYKRLKIYFGEEVSFNIDSILNKGTTVEFTIPINKIKNINS